MNRIETDQERKLEKLIKTEISSANYQSYKLLD